MLNRDRSIEFFRLWAILETTALSFTALGIFYDAPLFVAAAGGMFYCITLIGVWMQVVRPLVMLGTAIALGIAAILVDEPWYYGAVGALALLVLANMPQNLVMLFSRSAFIARHLERLQRKPDTRK